MRDATGNLSYTLRIKFKVPHGKYWAINYQLGD